MDTKFKLKDHFFLSVLTLHLVKLRKTHRYDCRVRKAQNSLAYISSGSVKFSIMNETITAHAGDLIFVPEGNRYISHWSGSPDICFYNVHFSMSKKTSSMWKNIKLQRIDGAPNEEIRSLIEQMYALSSQGNEAENLQTIGLFYQTLALLFPHIKMNPLPNFPTALQNAIEYIENNYTSIKSVREIATACFLSESHLYHLFKEYLDISPVSYLNHLRVHAAIEMLANSEMSIQQISQKLNFHSEYYFRKTFQKFTGELPSKMRKML